MGNDMDRRFHQQQLRFFLVVASAFLATTSFAAGDLNGRIRGVITEADTGAPVPGATVTINGKKLIGGPQTVQSGEDGLYQFVELPPGSYDVDVTYAGVKPIHRKVLVLQGETAPLDIAWSAELTDAEVTEVDEERHMTKPDSAQTGTVLSSDTEGKLATARSYTDVAQQVAGIKADRGLPVVKGANRLSNHYLVDGMDITDSVSNNFATQTNFDSIASLEVLTGGMEAQYNSLGGVINVNTATGSDEFHLDTSFYLDNAALSANNVDGSQLYEHSDPYSSQSLGPNSSYFANFNVSGPILKQRLWYNVSLEYDYLQSSLVPGPPLDLQHPPEVQHLFHPRFKFTWAPSSKNRLTLSASGDPGIIFNKGQSNSELGEAEYGQTQGGAFTVLQWDYFASQNVSAQIQTGFNFNHTHVEPMGQFLNDGIDYGPADSSVSAKNYAYNPNEPQHTNEQDGTIWYNYKTSYLDERYTAQLDPSLSLRGTWFGDHDAKFGLQTRFVYDNYHQHVPGGMTYTDDNGANGEAGLCSQDPTTGAYIGCANSIRTITPDYGNHAGGFGAGIFAQDRWRVTKRLMILPGIRLDWGITENTVGQVVSNLWGVGPRLGFTYDLTGDQKTILTAYYGRANDTLDLLPAIYADPIPPSTVQRFNSTTGQFATTNQTGGSGGYLLDPNVKPPHTDEISIGVNREFFKNSVAGLNYTYKRVSNIWQEVEVNEIWDPTGERVIGYVNGQKTAVEWFTTPDQAYRNYHGIDLTLESRPNEHWDVYVGYTLSWLFGTAADEVGTNTQSTIGSGNGFNNPRQTKYYSGYLPEDSRHNIKAHASYTLHGLSAGGTLNYASGSPLSKQYYNSFTGGYNNLRGPVGTDASPGSNDPTAYSTFQTPDSLMINLRVSYDMSEILHQHLLFMVDIFNLFNFDTATTVETRDIATFGQATSGRLAPLHVQLAARYSF